MFDTVQLNLTDYKLDKNIKLTLKPASIDLETGLKVNEYILSTDPFLEGEKAVHNSKTLNFHIKQVRGCNLAFVKFSLPKQLYQTNLDGLGLDGTREAFNKIESELDAAGVKTDIKKAKISRLDFCKNIQTEYRFREYLDVLVNLKPSRHSIKVYDTTVLYSKKSSQFCIYDKVNELKQNCEVIDSELLNKNIMRFETRFLKHRVVSSKLRIATVNDLLNNYERTSDVMSSYTTRLLFNIELNNFEGYTIDGKSIKDLLILSYKSDKRGCVNRCLARVGMAAIAEMMDVEAFKRLISDVIDELEIKNKRMRKSRDMRCIDKLYRGMRISKKENKELYEELKLKYLSN